MLARNRQLLENGVVSQKDTVTKNEEKRRRPRGRTPLKIIYSCGSSKTRRYGKIDGMGGLPGHFLGSKAGQPELGNSVTRCELGIRSG